MSALKTIAVDVEKYGPAALEAIATALAIIGVGGESLAVISAVEAALRSFADGAEIGADPQTISDQLAMIGPKLALDDEAADAAVDKKFPSKP